MDGATGKTFLEDADFAPWYFGEPNGNTAENCVVVWVNRKAWNDQDCAATMCGFCELDEAPDVRIRGTVFLHMLLNKHVCVFNSI